MPLPAPILDDRSYQQLRDELVRRIPVYAREWTDHNAADPGITLIELFAFLGENLLFRFNQIPEATKLAFLELLQIPLRQATAARTMVVFARRDGATVPASTKVPIDAGTELKAGNISFETLTEVDALPVAVAAFAKLAAPEPASPEAQDYLIAAADAVGPLAPGEARVVYHATRLPEDPATVVEPVDFAATVDGALWIAVLGADDATTVADVTGRLLNVGFMPDESVRTLDDVSACPGIREADDRGEVIWEVSTATIRGGRPVYRPVTVEADTTRALTQRGVVRLSIPSRGELQPGNPDPQDPYLIGTGSFPPPLDDDKAARRLLFWLRATRRRASSSLGRVLFVGANATEVVQTRTALTEFVGVGTGDAAQAYRLVHTPVIAGSALIQVEEGGRWTDWTAVDVFEGSEPDARHYILDLEAGTVRFGNGVRGRAPQIGERIRAKRYRYGGGSAGNVGAKAISTIGAPPNGVRPPVDLAATVTATNPLPARGGAPKEPIADALERVPGELRRRDRAVTSGDFQELALATPGAGVGRADCLPLFHPPTRSLDAAGVVSVVVWPRDDAARPNAPMPDRTLLRDVCCWLDARRLVTTELYVIPPTYRRVAVAIGLQPKPGYGVEAVRRWVELVVRQYLAPLPPYGPEGRGWPLGRRVYGPELEAAALQVEGVEFLEGLEIARWDEPTRTWVAMQRQPIVLDAWEVVQLDEITVVQGQPLAPGEALGAPEPPVVIVPIPTIREEC